MVVRVTSSTSQQLTGLAYVLLAAFGYGWLYVLAKWAYAGQASPTMVLVVRFGVAAIVLWTWLLFRRRPLPGGSRALGLIALGGLFSLSALAMFAALERLPASTAALLQYTYPAMVAMATAVVLREPLRPRHWVAVVLCTLGGWLTTAPGSSAVDVLGVGLALASAASYALYIVVSSRAARGVSGDVGAALVVTTAAVVNAALGSASATIRTDVGLEAWAAMVGIALFSTVLALGAFLAGVARAGAVPAAVASAFEPVVAVALAAALLGEAIGSFQVLGGVLVLSAVLLLASTRARASAAGPARTPAPPSASPSP
ncbi:MAG TPA: DMT family transporter [Chloroflexota bacterium]